MNGPLVVSTRPADRGHALLERLAAAGFDTLAMPVLGTRAVHPAPTMGPADVTVFVSLAAVEHGVALLPPGPPVPVVVAVGRATRDALEARGLVAHCPAAGFDTEAMLALPVLASLVAGARVALVRGVGGRELLREALEARGVSVEVVEVYERTAVSFDPAPLGAALDAGRPVALVVTSVEGLERLDAGLVGPSGEMLRARATVVTYSERIARSVREAAFAREPIVVPPGDDEALVAALRSSL